MASHQRRGLNPLTVHIGMAASEIARENSDDPELQRDRFAAMLRGIQMYQAYDREIEKPLLTDVWQIGRVRLRSIHPYDSALRPLVLIPSMINRASIFNLMHGRSMMAYFAQQGFAVYLVDWNEPTQDEGQKDLNSLVQDRLIPALHFVADLHQSRVFTLGYCMGGVLQLAALLPMQDKIAGSVFLGTPWDFHAGSQALYKRVEFWAPTAFENLHNRGQLDQDWVQTIFASLDPILTRNKFTAFADMDPDAQDTKLFVAVEDWLNDGVNLPAAIARSCIQDWYFDNAPCKKQWSISDKIVDPAALNVPSLVIASRKDRLVDFESSHALFKALPQADLLEPDCGHIGMIAGRHAVTDVWQKIFMFLDSCKNLQS